MAMGVTAGVLSVCTSLVGSAGSARGRPLVAPRVPVKMSGGGREVKRSGSGTRNQKGRWVGMDEDVSDDQADITRGKGMVDAKFQQGNVGGTGVGTHESIQFTERVQSNLETKNFDTREVMSWADAVAAAAADDAEGEEGEGEEGEGAGAGE